MINEETPKESDCLPLTSIDLLDSRTRQEREAEIVAGRIATISGECWFDAHSIFNLKLFTKKVAVEVCEAVQVERQRCVQIIKDYNNLHPCNFIDKYQCDDVISAMLNRR